MMRHAITLAPIILLVVLMSQLTYAQEMNITFRKNDVMQLAHTIVSEAARTNQLPPSFNLPMANGHTMVVTAPNVFELLVRATVTWKDTKGFPEEVPLKLLDLTIPAPDPQFEPELEGVKIPVFSEEIGEKAHYWLQIAEAPGHKLFSVMKFGMTKATTYRLTPAQIIVAMAVLIEQSVRENKLPLAVAVPMVHSPQDWTDVRKPIVVGAVQVEAPPPPLIQPDLRITVQGIELSERGPLLQNGNGPLPPFCGAIRIELTGYGPITKVRLLLDTIERKVFNGLGPHTYDLNTLALFDGSHILAATAIDEDGKTHAYIFSFTVVNGRENGFTPAERDGEREAKRLARELRIAD